MEVRAQRHSLLQLPERRIFETRCQFGLTRKNQWQQLDGRSLDVGKQTHLLQHFETEALRLVDDERNRLPGVAAFS